MGTSGGVWPEFQGLDCVLPSWHVVLGKFSLSCFRAGTQACSGKCLLWPGAVCLALRGQSTLEGLAAVPRPAAHRSTRVTLRDGAVLGFRVPT